MPIVKFNTALIVGAGAGLSAALARVLATEGIKVALAARSTGDLDGLAKEIKAPTFTCDASKRADVEKLFADLDGGFDRSTGRMKENREVSPVQLPDEIAEALRGALVKHANSRNPFVAAAPAGIRRPLGGEKNHRPSLGLPDKPVMLPRRQQAGERLVR